MPLSNALAQERKPANRTFGVAKRPKLHKIEGLKDMKIKAENEVENL